MIVLMFAMATLVPRQDWFIGVEREVDEGYYMKVIAAQDGWRVWRMENRYGIRCNAVKSARGRRHPVPGGSGFLMTRDTPFLQLDWSTERSAFNHTWSARHFGGIRAKYRAPGARFWEEGTSGQFEPGSLGEQAIEVVIESYEYPGTNVGRSDESAIFELAGLGWAQIEARRCTEAIPLGREPFYGTRGS